MAADFIGTDVMCPSCRETLRLPKTPEEAPPHTGGLENPTAPAVASDPAQPARPAHLEQDTGPSVPRPRLSTTHRRLKLTFALLLSLTAIGGALLFFPPEESTPDKAVLASAPLVHPETTPQEKPAPPPPPIALSEMPVPAPPSLPESEETPVPEVAVVQPVPEPAALATEAVAGLVENAPEIPVQSPEPLAAVEEPGLVEVIPATPEPAPEQPAAPPAVQPETAPADLVHTVVRGDTLSKLSRKYQVGIATIKKVNGMKGDAVMLGQKLKIPGAITPAAEPAPTTVVETPAQEPQVARSHTVIRGDTLVSIARKYSVTPRQIMQANDMKSDVVHLGRKLVIPAAP